MSRQIIKQPNGLYCLYSTTVDNVLAYDMEKEDVIEWMVNDAKKDIIEKVNDIISALDGGEKPYYQFTMTFDGMIDWIKGIHGEHSVKDLMGLYPLDPNQ